MKKSPYLLYILLFSLATALFGSPAWADNISLVNINVDIDLSHHRVEGNLSTRLIQKKPAWVHVGTVKLDRVTLAGRVIRPDLKKGAFCIVAPDKMEMLKIQFHRDLSPSGHMTGNFVDTHGAVLLDNWCPIMEGPTYYRLKATVPVGFKAMSEADSIETRSKSGTIVYTFEFPYPRTGLSLVVGQYQVTQRQYKGIEIATYFFPEDQGLAQKYIDKARYYLKLYEKILGPYPFKRFAIVENLAPTGYGLPSYTLLGQQVLRLPFIPDTSLGHEILHSWFGNSVYVDSSEGNWCEGLTTYLADYLYEKQKGHGKAYRHRVLIDYQSYVHKDNAMSLSKFEFRSDRSSKAVGYGKGAMVFHMLKQEIGEKAFYEALRGFVQDYRFKMAAWSDLEMAFSASSKKGLSGFFRQWLQRKDVPILHIKNGSLTDLGNGIWRADFTIEQGTERPYSLSVPIVVDTNSGRVLRTVQVDTSRKAVDIEIKGHVLGVSLDPGYDLMRKLSPPEFPPVLSRILGSEHRFFVAPAQNPGIYAPIRDLVLSLGFKEIEADRLSDTVLAKGSFIILGDPTPRLRRLTGKMPLLNKGVVVSVRKNPLNSEEVLGLIKTSSPQELGPIPRKLLHYGQYSTLRFEGGNIVKKETAATQDGIPLTVKRAIMAISAKELSPVDRIINEISQKRVIYIGERHDMYGHHMAELRIIQGLVQRGCRFAVGMEMFQRPFQGVLDRYLNGKIDERTFLKKSEYFKRWDYNYRFYRPIIDYCKGHDIPIVALNLPAEISKKVARKGLESLSDKEMKQVPQDIDWSNRAYKTRLMRIFKEHNGTEIKDFNNFYQAQILWDETMARSVYDYLKKNSGRQMVVLAGDGHIAFGYGIPSRVYRRGGYSQTTIVNVTGGQVEPGMADYFLFPREIQPPFSAKLGIFVKEEKDRLVIDKVMHHGPAGRAGLRHGDIFLDFDGRPIRDISDLKIALFFKKMGDSAQIKIKRIRRLAPDKIFSVKVGPFEPMSMLFYHRNNKMKCPDSVRHHLKK
ncbi:MAG: PDZ domain-containing protein [Nitrospiraceae bacterium]|nr:PDZ domain-containing protein [Nitrospiraceae bacterium]